MCIVVVHFGSFLTLQHAASVSLTLLQTCMFHSVIAVCALYGAAVMHSGGVWPAIVLFVFCVYNGLQAGKHTNVQAYFFRLLC